MENQSERNDPGPIVSGSRQIYLTFPAESTFTEEDVANYFKKYAEKLDLPMTCGSHYTDMDSDLHSRWESSRLLGKLFMEEQEQDIEVQTRRFSELQLAQKPTSNQSYFGYSVDELKASEAIACAYHSKFPSAERFNYPLDVLNSSSASDDINPKHSGTNHTDSESEQWEVNLPAEEVPPELPEPALSIYFARDGMQEKDWLALVAVHNDAWLLAVAFYFGARFGFDKAGS